ncbi:putative nuclease HARBI1 [Eriocheir sinensis]|uniref:putative nuclease HARBI1 n=1 Tax=Eriocheir sinensis TaxID=95602 RepID=UPI0021C6DC81|nr:putative nuclease HARBI1 [Eriocheir sinensis]
MDRSDLVCMLMQQHMNLQYQVHQHLSERRRRRRQQKRRVVRNIWVREWIARRPLLGLYDRLMVELRNEDPRAFQNFMRMPPAMFDEVVERLTPALEKKTTKWREPLEPGLKVALTLRHLASGAKYREMQYGWRVPHNTICIVVREVCEAIVEEFHDELLKPPQNAAEWRTVTNDWMSRWNFPHVIGAIDGKHIACKAPANSGSDYYNYKGFFSIILLAVVTSDYKFMWIDVSGKGSTSDAHIYNSSSLKEALEKNDLVGFPQPDPLPGDTEDVPYFLVGDDADALRTFMMKPCGNRDMTRKQRIFNYRLSSRARRVVENSFGILANRFQLLLTTMLHEPDTVRLLVKTCIILHNLMRIRYPVMQNRLVDVEQQDGQLVPGAWRLGKNLADTRPDRLPGNNRDFRQAKAQRNLIMEWCDTTVGSVPWQNNMLLPRF